MSIKRQFDLLKRSRSSFLSIKLLHPNKSGAAIWCRGAALHLHRQLQCLQEVALPTESKDAEQALELYDSVVGMLQVS